MAFGRAATVAGLVALGACAAPPPGPVAPAAVAPARAGGALDAYDRAVERQFLDAPFASGAMAVVVPSAGEVEAVLLVLCQEGRAACLGGANGAAAPLRATPDYLVVTGLGGQTLWLGRGGKGFVERAGGFAPLAWAPRVEGTGVGTEASLGAAVPHGPARPLVPR